MGSRWGQVLFFACLKCHREERSDMAISLIHLKRLPHPFRARNDIVKYILLIYESRQKARPDPKNVVYITYIWVKAKSKT
jgi:hypothetical protein